jgi:hypothetical protein
MRPIFVVQVRAEPSVDAIRALRAWLKIGLRIYGLRCVEVQESKQQGRMKMVDMDMREFSASVIMPEDLHDGPRVEKIVKISKKETEKYTCAVLEFESGDQVYIWPGQARILNKAWGYSSAGWLGQELELSLGHYIDKKTGTEKETIDVRAVSPRKEIAAGNGSGTEVVASKPVSLRKEMDDDIPFAPEWR